jgi:hypothetical protein
MTHKRPTLTAQWILDSGLPADAANRPRFHQPPLPPRQGTAYYFHGIKTEDADFAFGNMHGSDAAIPVQRTYG